MPVTKWNYQVTRAAEIPEAIAKAFYIARTGKPGPVLVDITKDAQFEMLEYEYKPFLGMRSYQPKSRVDLPLVRKAAQLINSAKKPFVLFGQGVILSHAEKEFKAFIEKAGIPSCMDNNGVVSIRI